MSTGQQGGILCIAKAFGAGDVRSAGKQSPSAIGQLSEYMSRSDGGFCDVDKQDKRQLVADNLFIALKPYRFALTRP
ncbi:hypothetical protein, partial [Caballeronia catudaia]|uniref:hypothetical protein n=1 Tax=Caballeronia catudaia TaxID=1777136 RepID=UPI000AF7A0F4